MRIKGRVIEGFKQGRLLGYPTANLHLSANVKRPKPGVYTCLVGRVDGSKYPAILISGVHQEVNGLPRLEVYLLNWQGNLYGEILDVTEINWLREVVWLSDPKQLKKIIQSDIIAATEFFANR